MALSDKFKLFETTEYNAMRTIKSIENRFYNSYIQILMCIIKSSLKCH